MYMQKVSRYIRGIVVFLMMTFLLAPSFLRAAGSPFVFKIPEITVDFRPVINVLTAPFRFVSFVKETLDKQGADISQKETALLVSPFSLAKSVKYQLDEAAPRLGAGLGRELGRTGLVEKGHQPEADPPWAGNQRAISPGTASRAIAVRHSQDA